MRQARCEGRAARIKIAQDYHDVMFVHSSQYLDLLAGAGRAGRAEGMSTTFESMYSGRIGRLDGFTIVPTSGAKRAYAVRKHKQLRRRKHDRPS